MRHIQSVADLPCCICGSVPVEVHHIRSAGLTGAGQKCSDWFTLPLCPLHHREFHVEGRRRWEMRHGLQVDWLEDTLERLYG